MCGRPVDDADTVEMPNGLVCLDPCYDWLERMMDEVNESDEEEEYVFIWEEDDEDQ